MKFSLRVKLAVVLSVLMVMLAGSALAAELSIRAEGTLDETGTVLTLTQSYLMDGKLYEDGGAPIDPALLSRIGEGLLIKIGIRPRGTAGAFQTYLSDSPIKFEISYQQAKFTLPTALEEGEYEFNSGRDGFNTVVKIDTPPYYSDDDAAWENFEQRIKAEFGAAFDDFFTRFIYVDDLYRNQGVYRGNTFLIKKEGVSTVPGAPTNVTATAGDRQATVRFNAPIDNGGSAITGYTVTANPGNVTATGTTTTITVTGLTNGTAYTFTVRAANSVGTGPASAASNSVTPTAGNSSSSSGGCNAGFGIVGLLLAGFVIRKYRKV